MSKHAYRYDSIANWRRHPFILVWLLFFFWRVFYPFPLTVNVFSSSPTFFALFSQGTSICNLTFICNIFILIPMIEFKMDAFKIMSYFSIFMKRIAPACRLMPLWIDLLRLRCFIYKTRKNYSLEPLVDELCILIVFSFHFISPLKLWYVIIFSNF